MNIHNIELGWMQQMLDAIRGPLLNQFFLLWRFVDTFGFSLILVVTIWYLFNRPIGIRILYIAILAAAINKFLKGFFGLPRPCQIDPSIGLSCLASPGFPSGAAQTSMLILGVAFLESKNKVLRCSALVFALLLSFSRVYLGVHFITDILGGWVVGGGLLVIYAKVFPLVEKNWRRYIFLFPVLLLFIAQAKVTRLFGYSVGIAIGLLSYEKVKRIWKDGWLIRFWQLASVLIGEFAILWLMKIYPAQITLFSIGAGIWLSFLGAYLVQRLRA
ncbi:MAG: phosphatase PAP2 family protein [Simkaniaceae bacterium]|nr:phosphatase PAP2 family protein [Candidatus Sacchlamyda saccharinae]